MKKYSKVFLLILLCSFFSIIKVSATTTFYVGDKISGVYLKVNKSGKLVYRQIKEIKSYTDNYNYYCIEMNELLTQNAPYESSGENQAGIAGLSEEKWNRINNLAYYGYGYGTHTDLYWKALTQVLIWRELIPSDWSIEFTDTLVGKVNNSLFANEINEINNLINSHNILPTIANQSYETNVNEQLVLQDNNNVLDDYEITAGNNTLESYIANNSLYVKSSNPGDYTLTLKRKNTASNLSKIYFITGGQKVIQTTSPSPNEIKVNIHIKGGKIELNKLDYDHKTNQAYPDTTLQKAVYEIYDENNNLITSITTNADGYGITDYLKPGKYYLKEKTPSLGYELDLEKHYFEIKDNEVTNVKVYEKVIKIKVYFEKYLTDLLKFSSEANISFEITRLSDNTKFIVTTNKYGKVNFELTYGKYKVHQLNSKYGFKMVDDFEIEVNDKTDKKLKYVLEDELIKKKIIINKKDSNTKLNLTAGFRFKIFNIELNKYVEINKQTIFTTNDLGIIELELPYGKYYLEEIYSLDNYHLNLDKLYFEINPDSLDIIELEFYNEMKTYEVPNTNAQDYNLYILLLVGAIYVFKKII